jgi:hypothetical protein
MADLAFPIGEKVSQFVSQRQYYKGWRIMR